MQTRNVLVSLVEIPKPMITLSAVHCVLDIERRHVGKHKGWRNDQISLAQLQYLNSFGVLATNHDLHRHNKGTVSDVINTLVSSRIQRERLQYHLEEAGDITEIGVRA